MTMRVKDFKDLFAKYQDEQIVHIHVVSENDDNMYGEEVDIQRLSGSQLLFNVYV